MKYKMKTIDFFVIFLFLFLLIPINGCNVSSSSNPGEAEVERDVLNLVNQHRVSIGLEALEWNETIAIECRDHSRNMASGSVSIAHDGFDQRAANIGDTIPYTLIGENVAYINTGASGSSSPASLALNGWLNNTLHRDNIEGNYNLTGVGVAKDGSEYYFTQIFVNSN
jgi:uncharacterized protein YkwD